MNEYKPYKEIRPYTVLSEYNKDGCKMVDIQCPFCNITVTAHVWSLAGSGKRCNCGVLHTYLKGTINDKKNPAKKGEGL
jgi:hypothetical protein